MRKRNPDIENLRAYLIEKRAGALSDRLNAAIHNVSSSPIGQLAHGVASMTPQGQQILQHAQGAANRLQQAAGHIEAHPAYQAAGVAKEYANLIRNDPNVRQHVIEPIKANPFVQGASAVAQHVAAPVQGAVQNVVQGANQAVSNLNAAVAPVVPVVNTANAARENLQAVKGHADALKGHANVLSQEVQQHGMLGALQRQLSGQGPALVPEQVSQAIQQRLASPAAPAQAAAPAALPAQASAPAPAATASAPAPAATAAPAPTPDPAAPASAPAQVSPSFMQRIREYLSGVTARYGITDPNVRQNFLDSILARFGYQPMAKASSDHALGVKLASESGAWQRSEGKNPEGGLNAKGRASLKAQGHDIKPGVKGEADTPDKMRRKGSFLSRMYGPGAPGSMKQENGEPSRRALSAKAWGEAVPSDDAGRARLYAKGQALLKRYEGAKEASFKLRDMLKMDRLAAQPKPHNPLLPKHLQFLASEPEVAQMWLDRQAFVAPKPILPQSKMAALNAVLQAYGLEKDVFFFERGDG